jgi:hypothetical protein
LNTAQKDITDCTSYSLTPFLHKSYPGVSENLHYIIRHPGFDYRLSCPNFLAGRGQGAYFQTNPIWITFPYAPCMEYLPTFALEITQM